MISKIILNLFFLNVCAKVYNNTNPRQFYGSNNYIAERHYNINDIGYNSVSYESHQNSITFYKVDNNTPTNIKAIDGDNLSNPQRYNNSINNVNYSSTAINVKNNLNGSVTTSSQTTYNSEDQRGDNSSANIGFNRDFYSNISVNLKYISLYKFDKENRYLYAGEYKYVEGELAHFKCDRFQPYRTELGLFDKSYNKILFGEGNGDHVEAYIRLQASNNPIKIQCLTEVKIDDEYMSFVTNVYLFPQEKEQYSPHFVVNGVTLPIIRQQTQWFQRNNFYDSEYFNYLDEKLDISLTSNNEFNAAICSLILYPTKELKNVTYTNDTISLKPHTFALSCEFNDSQTKPFNLTLYSKTKKYNHLPLLNTDKEEKFENFTNTEPCIYGLRWSKILAKYNKYKNHVYIRYQYGIDEKYIKIVGVSRRDIKIHYDPVEVSIKKSPSHALLINWNNETYKAHQYKVALKEDFNKSSIIFQSSGSYTVELIKTGVQQKGEKMLILKRNSLDEVIETKSNSNVSLEPFDDNKSEFYEDITVDTAANNVTTNGSQNGTNIVEIITITVSSILITIIIVLGVIGAKQALRWKKNRREPEVTVSYNSNCRRSEHIYETVDYDSIGVKPSSPDIKQRPPQPLPPEALEENQLVYDTVYDFRIFPTRSM